MRPILFDAVPSGGFPPGPKVERCVEGKARIALCSSHHELKWEKRVLAQKPLCLALAHVTNIL